MHRLAQICVRVCYNIWGYPQATKGRYIEMAVTKRLSGELEAYQADVLERIIGISDTSKIKLFRRAVDIYLLQQKDRLLEVGIKLPDELTKKEGQPYLLDIPLPGPENKKPQKRRKN